MKFVKHENFPDAIANLIRHLEHWERGETTIQFPQELYGNDVNPGEWLLAVGSPARQHRPTVLTLDSGIKENAVNIKAMKQSGCSFVVFARGWMKEPLRSFAWKAIRAWSAIVDQAEQSHEAKQQCRMDVSINGNITLTNL